MGGGGSEGGRSEEMTENERQRYDIGKLFILINITAGFWQGHGDKKNQGGKRQ